MHSIRTCPSCGRSELSNKNVEFRKMKYKTKYSDWCIDCLKNEKNKRDREKRKLKTGTIIQRYLQGSNKRMCTKCRIIKYIDIDFFRGSIVCRSCLAKKKNMKLLLGYKKCSKCGKILRDIWFWKNRVVCKKCMGIKVNLVEVAELSKLGYKRCSKCKKVKKLEEFNKNDWHREGGKTGRCKECSRSHSEYAEYLREARRLVKEGKKRCRKCKEIKPLQEFTFRKDKNRYYYICNKCRYKKSKRKKEVEEKRREREHLLKIGLKRCRKCKEIKPLHDFYIDPRRVDGVEGSCKDCRRHMQNTRRTAPSVRINNAVGAAIYKSITKEKAGRRWEDLVGYTLEDLMQHLESRFKEGMSWDNYGEWHIDHIKPRSSFNFESVDSPEFKECWSLDNLQPLWAEENIRKGSK